MMYLTKREDEIMNVFWNQDTPLTVDEVEKHLNTEDWNNHMTVYRTINGLEKKKLIEVCGMEKRNKQYARQFRPVVGQDEYYSKFILDHGMRGSVLKSISAALLGGAEKSGEDVSDKLDKIVDDIDK